MSKKIPRRNFFELSLIGLLSLSQLGMALGPSEVVLNDNPPKQEISIETDISLEEKIAVENAFIEMDEKFDIDYYENAIVVLGNQNKLYLVREELPNFYDFFHFLHNLWTNLPTELSETNINILASYDISPGAEGYGRYINMTPIGIHRIKEKIGGGAEIGRIFIGRQPAGMSALYDYYIDTEDDYVTTRIMWLDGLEPGNLTSYDRYIYLHGTPEEGLLGRRASQGCIRMGNEDIIKLFDRVKEGTYVNIVYEYP